MANLQKKGLLITIEGIDGSGKSSAAHALASSLAKNYDVLLTKEPGATQLGKHLRALLHQRTFDVCPQSEFLLFAADRAQHMNDIVLPALRMGKIVISDRMADSSRAYQGFGRGVDDAWIKSISEWAMQNIKPDLTLYLKTDYVTAIARLKKRYSQSATEQTMTVFEREHAAFFERVIEGFETIFKERSSVITINAGESEEKVHKTMIEKVNQFVQI